MNNDPNEFPSYNQPLPPSPYEQSTLNMPSSVPSGPPPVVGWYKAYAAFMVVIYLLCTIGGFFLLQYASVIVANSPTTSLAETKIQGGVLMVIGIALFIAYVVALILPNTPGSWIYHIVMIAIGLTSCCLWPVAIPLLIAWLKPKTQQFFGRFDAFTPRPNDPNLPPPPIPSA